MSNAIIENENREWLENRKHSAFTAWLIGGKGKTFNKYCQAIGLIENVNLSKEEKRLIKQSTMECAAEIIEADKRERLNGKNRI